MSRSLIPLTVALFASALVAVPTAFGSGGHRGIRVQGVCSQTSTSTLKLSREDRGIEVEFEVDQNRNGVPWKVTLRRNGARIASLTATTRAPSGSFEIHRVIAGRLRTDRITATATRASGETCVARSRGGARANAGTIAAADDSGHDLGHDHGHDAAPHS